MQHDGRRWRCLVACAYRCRPDGIFSAHPTPRIRGLTGSAAVSRNARGHFVPPPDAWLHEPQAGNAGLAGFIPPSALLDEFSPSQAMTLFVSITE